MSNAMAEEHANSDSPFTTPADVRQIIKQELQDYFGPRGADLSGESAGGTFKSQSGTEADPAGWSVKRELEAISRTSRVETSIEYLGKQMVDGFARMDKRFEDLIHYMDKRFEQVDQRFVDLIHQMDKRFEQVDKRFEDLIHHMDKRFSLIQWTMGIGFTMITVLMSVYYFMG